MKLTIIHVKRLNNFINTLYELKTLIMKLECLYKPYEELLETVTNKTENDTMDKTPPPGEIGEYISSAQAAKILGVTMSRIRQFVMDGRLKSHGPKKGRRDHLFDIGEVKKFAKEDREITGRPAED